MMKSKTLDNTKASVGFASANRLLGVVGAHGFTLVELLVVIGVISILIAMLLPALNKARNAARTVQCLSNMHQQGLSILMYANENNGYGPPCGWSADLVSRHSGWAGLISRMLSPQYASFPNQDQPYSDFYLHGVGKIFVCPSNIRMNAGGDEFAPKSYVGNEQILGRRLNSGSWYITTNGGLPWSWGMVDVPMKLTSVRKPADTFLIIEDWNLQASSPIPVWSPYYDSRPKADWGETSVGFADDSFETYHGGKSHNCVFVDGHASAVPKLHHSPGQVYFDPRYNPRR